jgi:predicted alpha/beta hydrolase family esterase
VFDTVGSPPDDFNPMAAFLILHGLGGSGPEHWQTRLAERLRGRGERVSYPHLPDPLDPHPADWGRALSDELALLEDPVVLCHSLACLLWLRTAARPGSERIASRVLLVAPPHREDLEPVARFLEHGARARDVTRASRETLIVCSDDDPYCPPGAVDTYAQPLGIPAHVISGAGHINPESGYGEWPDVEAWALGAAQFPLLYSP